MLCKRGFLLWLTGCLWCCLAIAAVAQSPQNGAPATAAAPPQAQATLFDRYIAVHVPAGWIERRSWELGEDRSLPLYNPANQAVAFVWGFDRPAYRQGYIESLATDERLSRRLEMDLSLWPAEAARYYAMVSGGFTMRRSAHAVTVGPSLKPGTVHYLGKVKAGRAELDAVEYISEGKVDAAFATIYRMSPEMVGRRAQIVFGQATFGHGTEGYTLVACRFIGDSEDAHWLDALLENIEPVGKSEREKGATAEQVRDELSHAAAVLEDHRYAPALAQLQTVLQQDPQNDNALMLQGEALLYMGKLDEAERALRQAVTTNPNNDRAHFLLGAVLWEEKQPHAAMAEWTVVKRLSPLYPQIEEVLREKGAQQPVAATEKQP